MTGATDERTNRLPIVAAGHRLATNPETAAERPLNSQVAFKLDESQSGISAEQLPTMIRVRQVFERPVVADIRAAVRREIEPFLARVASGSRIAVTGSSRGIPNLPTVINECIRALRDVGAEPFVIPGMGSHGGATDEGQIEVLANNGITEQSVGAPIHSSMEVIQVGTTSTGFPVYQDRNACNADGVLAVNRVKPHTGFTEIVESGICKMLVIGLGKQAGAQKIHQQSLDVAMGRMVREASKIILESNQTNFIGAIALVDNAFKETAVVEGIPMQSHDELIDIESGLLKRAYELFPRIPFDQFDTLIVDEMGKNVSGSGMDTNVIGTKPGMTVPRIGAIYVRSLTPETHGNATGIGAADVIPRRLLEEIDLHSTYMNAFTAKRLGGAKMPMMVETDLQAMQVCLTVRADEDPTSARVVRIRNTSKLEEFWASEALAAEINENPRLEIIGDAVKMAVDGKGVLS
jgi:hypothetical protein